MIGPIETFINECEEHLTTLEEALLELENNNKDGEQIDRAFRAMHTIKGAGGMFGYQFLSDFTHYLETAFDKVRKGECEITTAFTSTMLNAKDTIQQLIQSPEPSGDQRVLAKRVLDSLQEIVPQDAAPQGAVSQDKVSQDNAELFETSGEGRSAQSKGVDTPTKVFRIQFTPPADTLKQGMEVFPILRELSELGESYVTTHSNNLPCAVEMEVENCYLTWDITLATENNINAVKDVFIFVEEDWDINVSEVDLLDQQENSDRLGELLVERGLLTVEQLSALLEQQTSLGKLICAQGLADDSQIVAALNEQQATREAKSKIEKISSQDAIVRVPASRLDKLMNLVGELVIVQARLNQIAAERDDEQILTVSEDLDLLTTEMRDHTFNIRMLPIGTTFGRFRRLVRDLSCGLNKNISLETYGAETELDKMVIDKLGDPLVHLIRNSIDHGIEEPEQRVNAGKTAQGTVTLSARHSESQVIIEIKDDGRGLDPEKLKNKAIESGLISEAQNLTDEEIFPLIFEPGFSTAKEVSDISGRGVGMDVVRRSIQELGGRVDISSALGEGTCIKIKLPMTLAIIEGLLVTVSGEHYVLPLGAVEECIELPIDAKPKPNGKRLVDIRGQLVPYMHLREWFEINSSGPKIEQVVITRLGDERFGFCVDDVVGQYQTVVKRLGKLYEGVNGFSGATILGDGSVAMILDPEALMTEAGKSSQPIIH